MGFSSDKVTETLVNIVPKIWNLVKKFYSDKQIKLESELGTIYKDYLEYSCKKYSTVKTLLYKNEGKFLYNFYEPQFLESESGELIDTSNSNMIFQKNHKIIVTGTGGIGKSMLMKHIFINQVNNASSIPIFIELKSINAIQLDDFDFETFIFQEIERHHLNIPIDYFKETLKTGEYTIIFDGLDEIVSTHRNMLDQSLKKFVDVYYKNKYILSSRPSDDFIGWSNFSEYEVKLLTKEQAVSLIGRLDYDTKVKNKFSRELKDRLFDNHESFASIPLLLTIMLMTYEDGASIPNNLTDFYNQSFYTLYQKHDASKSGYKRELKANLSPEQFKEVLSYLAMKTFFKGQITFNDDSFNTYLNDFKKRNSMAFINSNFIKDSISNVCMISQEGINYKFAHRSFQEYFAGVGVSKLDDSTQKKLLTSWAIEDGNHIAYNKTFLTTLLTVQKNRTYLNLHVELIKKVRALYEDLDDLGKFISHFFKTFKLSLNLSKVGSEKIGFYVSDEYKAFYSLHFKIIKESGLDISDIDDDATSEMYSEKVIEFLENNRYITYDQFSEEYKSYLRLWIDSWFVKRLNFIFEWSNQVVEKNKTKKRTTSAIIDDI
ncbi:NACHT domain-containing protein [Streptococcus constellatus]|uniref:NACHT domain-containing protein n=1 Tax=Streptococcus constellatus TaxID=76860 RepID=UPI002000F2E0|nr:NTPase [Streptococcus constellatus]